jgi:hypothetical protein
MKTALAARKRASFVADLKIVLLGVWGFVLQTLKCWGRGNDESDELESGH